MTPSYLLLSLIILHHILPCPAKGGTWSLLQRSIGISAMHMQLLPNDRVVMYDRKNFGTSNISLPKGKCPPNSIDCTAHSIEYDVASNSVRPLMVLTDFWCSSGSLMTDGTLVQTGGDVEGAFVVRTYKSCDTCDWEETPNALSKYRWYATNHKLPDGRQIIIGGRGQHNYEFYPKTSKTETAIDFPFLAETTDLEENNLYPFVFLYPDGNLFIYANNRAIFFDYVNNQVVKNFPIIPGGDPRNYPSTGSSVLLPMRIVKGNVPEVEFLICGGAPKLSFLHANNNQIFDKAMDTCGRMKISDPDPKWVMETMPLARVMGDMLLLPNGHVLIINGGSAGAAAWEIGRDPVLTPVIYRPDNPKGTRFEVQTGSGTPRMYHSTALLIRDGSILVGGSNPHDKYQFGLDVLFPTELSLEKFSPSYLDSTESGKRPVITSPGSGTSTKYGKRMVITFAVTENVNPGLVKVTMVSPSFNTHSFSMNQRLLILESDIATTLLDSSKYQITVTMPPSNLIAPPGYYMLFVVHKDIPSEGIWVHIK
ncbi:aldehyde oxidase GLOX-like [Rutidosis leptorrhynchoides]|uniref:aldehyde oxidase GLOX-like n=1 Tax=Rutidosis leptorrhynchoides TaxID=125765 RepID=UPI003A9979B6